jgi:GDPmannose 4,6-dehydratase
MKKALITGITGQDGSYLAEFLLEKGYEVHGIVRRAAMENPLARFSRISHIQKDLHLHPGDLTNYGSVLEIFDSVRPDECYHLAAQSFVGESFEDPFTTFKVNTEGTLHVLAAARKKAPKCRVYFAATSEMFGEVQEIPQKETTIFYPRSPYGVSKVAGYHLVRNYRESYNLFACSGILFNHEGERRGHEFVTRKITQAVARMKSGKQNVLVLGNMSAKRDWGHAEDYVRAMWLMLQQDKPDDYVVATGENHSVKEFVDFAFQAANLNYELIDLHELSPEEADQRIEYLKQDKSKLFVVTHPRFYRPAEVDSLLGDPSKAKINLGWKPEVSFQELVQRMVENDIQEES